MYYEKLNYKIVICNETVAEVIIKFSRENFLLIYNVHCFLFYFKYLH